LIVHTDYAEFQRWLYGQHPGLEEQPYEVQLRTRNESLFGVADFYSSNLRKLGHEAYDVYANNEFMQKAWAREHGIQSNEPSGMTQSMQGALRQVRHVAGQTFLRHIEPLFRPILSRQPPWFTETLAAQIKYYAPDVLLNQAMAGISTRFLKKIKPFIRLLVGQHAAGPFPSLINWRCYDLVVSSFPPTVELFRAKQIPAEVNRLGFEPRVLSCLEGAASNLDVTFIGSFYKVHSSRIALMENLCGQFGQTRVWGPTVDHLPSGSAIRKCYVRQAWGKEMYQILRNSKITLNHHGDVGPYANNLRLYEATGVGTLLITDWKVNLHEMFEPGKEVVAYRTPEECAQLVEYYLKHDEEREAIAHDGQERTLREHTFYQRMQELVAILDRYS